jgi:hypothetical protein
MSESDDRPEPSRIKMGSPTLQRLAHFLGYGRTGSDKADTREE